LEKGNATSSTATAMERIGMKLKIVHPALRHLVAGFACQRCNVFKETHLDRWTVHPVLPGFLKHQFVLYHQHVVSTKVVLRAQWQKIALGAHLKTPV
jgi:hypothetical protein|tara:strand:+ start:181 stop:471 length:291 start_codon:yes stop_codon:yes gene_type:complete